MSIYMCVEDREQPRVPVFRRHPTCVFLFYFVSLFVLRRTLIVLELADQVRLLDQGAPGIILSLSPQC